MCVQHVSSVSLSQNWEPLETCGTYVSYRRQVEDVLTGSLKVQRKVGIDLVRR